MDLREVFSVWVGEMILELQVVYSVVLSQHVNAIIRTLVFYVHVCNTMNRMHLNWNLKFVIFSNLWIVPQWDCDGQFTSIYWYYWRFWQFEGSSGWCLSRRKYFRLWLCCVSIYFAKLFPFVIQLVYSIHDALNHEICTLQYRSGTVNLKSFISKVLLQIKWKFELTYAL